MVGSIIRLRVELISRSQCRSTSGAQPSKARAPSNTVVPSQNAWFIGPVNLGLPSTHSPSTLQILSIRPSPFSRNTRGLFAGNITCGLPDRQPGEVTVCF